MTTRRVTRLVRTKTTDPIAAAPDPASHSTEESGRFCGSRRNKEPGTCRRPAGWATPHPGTGRCKFHGGRSPGAIKAGQRLAAERAVATFGLPISIPPDEALAQELARTVGAVGWLEALIRQQDPSALVWGPAEKVRRGSGEFPGTDVKFAAAPSVWLTIFQSERKHLLDVARSMTSLGIEAGRLDFARNQMAPQIALVIENLVARLNLTAEQRADLPMILSTVVSNFLAGGRREIEGSATWGQ